VTVERPSAALPEATPAAATHASGAEEGDIARRAQLLTTEHWSLLATRSMSWNEAFSRTSMFLSTLSAATVALALAGPAMSFGSAFALFALIVLSVTLFLGVATYVRLLQVNNEDLYWVTGMNMLRGEYTKMVPGIEKSFVAGSTLDPHGIARTFGAFDVTSSPSPLHMLITTPAIVGVISSAIAGIIAGLLTLQVGLDHALAIAVGLGVFVVAIVLSLAYGRRESRSYVSRAIEQRILSARSVDGDPPTPR
jgi:hypothetical protein